MKGCIYSGIYVNDDKLGCYNGYNYPSPLEMLVTWNALIEVYGLDKIVIYYQLQIN